MLSLKKEPLAALINDGLSGLLLAHWREVAHDKDVIPLDIDWDGYLKAEAAGSLLVLALRQDGVLIGYNSFFVSRSLHYKSTLFAVNDVVYLKPECRGIDGVFMILEAEKFLKALGVSKVFYHCKADAILGSVSGDSLEAIENRLEIEERLDIELPQEIETVGSRTLGQVLAALGYTHVEDNFGKLLRGLEDGRHSSNHRGNSSGR